MDVGTSNENNCAATHWFQFFSNFVKVLELLTLLGFCWMPLRSISFPFDTNIMKKSWKLMEIITNDCNHWTPNTTLPLPNWIEITELTNKYSLVFILFLLHFPQQVKYLHVQSSLEILVLEIQRNKEVFPIYN